MVLTLDAAARTQSLPRPTIVDDEASTAPAVERQRTIEQIIHINPTAAVDFLQQFKDRALRGYLDHLHATQRPRGRHSAWLRTAETSAAMERLPRG